MRVPTVAVNGENGPMIINEADYDEAKHGPKITLTIPEPAPVAPVVNMLQPAPGEIVPAMDVPGMNASAPPAPAPVPQASTIQPVAPLPPVVTPAMPIDGRGTAEIGGKWFIVDQSGAKVINKGYATEDAARAALTATAA